jgi:hypothetical protein
MNGYSILILTELVGIPKLLSEITLNILTKNNKNSQSIGQHLHLPQTITQIVHSLAISTIYPTIASSQKSTIENGIDISPRRKSPTNRETSN